MFATCVPLCALIVCLVGFGICCSLLYYVMNRERGDLRAEIKRLQNREQETKEENRESQKENYQKGYKAGWGEGLASIKVLTKNAHRVLDDGFFKKVTEASNLFVVMAGGEFKAGFLGQEELTEDQLRKLLESMQIVSGLIGCHSGSVMAEGLKKILDRRPVN